MITVHHLNNSRSQRILWLLEELGLEYDIVRYERDPETMLAPEALRAIHPLGKSPIVVDGDEVMAESGYIIERLVERYGADTLAPPANTPAHRQYRYWLHYAEGSAMLPLTLKLIFDRIEQAPVPFFIKPVMRGISGKVKSGYIDGQIALHLTYLNDALAEQDWFAGETFSAADIQLSFPLEAAKGRGDLSPYPRLKEFLKRIHGRNAYQTALARGGPYSMAA
ncbi:MAG: glutathione S-transferase [Rhodothalassiaceae bacterium]